MTRKRLLAEMAGLVPGLGERRLARDQRRAQRARREAEARVMLVDRIRRREAGEEGLKPMPFVGLRPKP